MPRSKLNGKKRGRSTFLVLLGLLLAAVEAPAQETTPVTVEVVFFDEEEGAQQLFGVGGGSNSPVSASARTSFYAFRELVLPRIEGKTSTEAEALRDRRQQPSLARPRLLNAAVRYESLDFNNISEFDLDGNSYLVDFQARWGMGSFEYGLLVPYEYLNLQDVNAYRIGALGFGHYRLQIDEAIQLNVVVNGNYVHTAIDDEDIDDVNTLGGGISSAMTLNKGSFVLGAATSYQFNADDTDTENDKQHLLKVGADTGLRVGRNTAFTLFGIWTYDPTDYDDELREADEDYFELGLEVAWSASPSWRLRGETWRLSSAWGLNGGYKKVLGFDDFDSDMVFVGAHMRF